MTDKTIKMQAEMILESGLDPEKWIHLYARDFREIVYQMTREGQVLNREFINLMLVAMEQDLFAKPRQKQSIESNRQNSQKDRESKIYIS